MWCIAHKVELTIKDALKGTAFDLIDDMLKLYYMYEKSPEKCRQLEEIICDLKDCLKFDDKGIKPVQASGSRWVTHRLKAMKHVISKYEAYISHLISLSEDSTIKAHDRAQLKGCSNKWEYILGCAFITDLLSPCATFSKSLRSDDLDVRTAFTNLLKTVKEINRFTSFTLEYWPTYSSILKNIAQDGNDYVYQ
uniref:DUF4371 domain-containing protein n=1 Tax=Amphimedon queenslandica TaxID=400682 RepID=A0A1X7TPP9_AMPQE